MRSMILPAVFAVLLPGVAVADGDAVAAARSYRKANAARILRDFADLLAIPNVAARPGELRRTAVAIRDGLASRGVSAELLEIDGVPPIVYGRLDAPGAERTLGIYVHYDGQPVDPSQWSHPPFEPRLYTAPIDRGGRSRPFPEAGEAIDPEWRISARGAGDDKAPVGAIFPALDALRAAAPKMLSARPTSSNPRSSSRSCTASTSSPRNRGRFSSRLRVRSMTFLPKSAGAVLASR